MPHDSLANDLILALYFDLMASIHSHHSHIRYSFSYDISSIYIYMREKLKENKEMKKKKITKLALYMYYVRKKCVQI
jgi:hypothetical protein